MFFHPGSRWQPSHSHERSPQKCDFCCVLMWICLSKSKTHMVVLLPTNLLAWVSAPSSRLPGIHASSDRLTEWGHQWQYKWGMRNNIGNKPMVPIFLMCHYFGISGNNTIILYQESVSHLLLPGQIPHIREAATEEVCCPDLPAPSQSCPLADAGPPRN